MSEIRVRFAPSPTGYLHVGGARTALFNYLFAKKNGGKFLLRIEDTDRTRYHEGALDEIFTSLRWMGLDWDEGPEVGGDCGPYFQSERLDLYKKYADELVEKGLAYHCFCSSERLDALRAEQESSENPQATGYDRHCRNLSSEEVAAKLAAGEPSVIRLKIPDSQTIVFDDVIRGQISFESDTLDDFVLLKTDGFPTYHLANVIDDHFMRISHVLRGDEWITSAPKHVLLYKAFGWETPIWAHLPVILSETGGKLSKRKGAASVMDYYREGVLPHALFNFLALLGWSPGDDKEIMTLEEMIELFTLDRIGGKPSVFDSKKLEWMNGQYIAESSAETLLAEVKPAMVELGLVTSDYGDAKILPVIDMMKGRSKKVTEIAGTLSYFFVKPESFDEGSMKKIAKQDNAAEVLNDIANGIESLADFSAESVDTLFHSYMEEKALGFGKVGMPVRVAITGVGGGPSMHDVIAFIGKEESVARLRAFIEMIQA